MLNGPLEPLRIADIVSTYVILEPSRKILKGNCPFHEDAAGSFIISPERNTFKCFGCEIAGGPAEFLTRINNNKEKKR